MVFNTKMISFDLHGGEYGSLVAIEGNQSIPFPIKRVYYIFDVEQGVRRGFHSHVNLQQVLICVHGSVTIEVKTPYEQENIVLDRPDKGLMIGPMVWREMYDFSPGAVLLVLANEFYSEQDYIRNYNDYLQTASRWFDEHPEGKR